MFRFWFTHNLGLKIVSVLLATLIWMMIHDRLPPVGVRALPVEVPSSLLQPVL